MSSKNLAFYLPTDDEIDGAASIKEGGGCSFWENHQTCETNKGQSIKERRIFYTAISRPLCELEILES